MRLTERQHWDWSLAGDENHRGHTNAKELGLQGMGNKSGELTLGEIVGGRKRDGGLRECGYLGPPWQVTVTSGQKSWYFVGANMPPNDLPALHWIKNELEFGPERVGKLLVGDLNAFIEQSA